MKLTELPRQTRADPPEIPEFLRDSQQSNSISGGVHEESFEEGDREEILEDTDVFVYGKAV